METENKELEKTESENEKKGKKWPWIFTVLIILAVIAAIIGITAAVAMRFIKKNFNYNYNEITSKPEDLGFEEVVDDRIVNIALFGIDTRNENSFSGRSDCVMIMSINTKTDKVKLISVLRDTLVPIDKNGVTAYNKLNNAYASGGPERAIKTLNTVFGLDISEYATVNFSGMAEIIDAVGGIEATVTQNELSLLNSGVYEHCNILDLEYNDYKLEAAGTQHLNGIQAVAYSRIRYAATAEGTTNDYGRTDRQRYVLGQLFKKATTLEKSQYMGLIRALMPCCETSLSYSEIFDLAVDVLLQSPSFSETRIPDTKYTMKAPNAGVGSIVYYDLGFAAKLIHAFIYDDITPEAYIEANGTEKNDWYSTGYTPPVFNHEDKQ
ncbi:MAG: LCP family protein [Clostridia bacterium]|nr:LCP family protein [Clostridia bacterium]